MTKEDKQIIERATKENWRIGDRTRLKHLLEKNLKLYRENVKLEKENRLLGERCNQLLKYKGELTDQIADIKANCDLAIEGRDIKIKELEQQIEKMKCCQNCKHCAKIHDYDLDDEEDSNIEYCEVHCYDKSGWELRR